MAFIKQFSMRLLARLKFSSKPRPSSPPKIYKEKSELRRSLFPWTRGEPEEHSLLRSARRLGDAKRLGRLARFAVLPDIRFEAAQVIDDQSALTALALAEWSIHRGIKAVEAIRYPFLLERIARSAQQDAIRLAAAYRLQKPLLIKRIAMKTKDIHLRWQAALYLKDPLIMADVARFKSTNEGLETLRCQANKTLLQHLDTLHWKQDIQALQDFIISVPHVPFKIEAFLRLPTINLPAEMLRYMAHQALHFTPDTLLKQMFIRIQAAGWHILRDQHARQCPYCRGEGYLLQKCMADDQYGINDQRLPCSECGTHGSLSYQEITCILNQSEKVLFQIPLHVN